MAVMNHPANATTPSSPTPFTNMFFDTLYTYSDFMGKDASNTIAQVANSPSTKRCIIIGAGAGGMCAAWELARVGILPLVLEASDRIGGRAWSKPWPVPTTDGQVPPFAEMGSMRVPPVMDLFSAYANKFGLKTVSGDGFPDPGKVPTRLYYQNKRYDWQPNHEPPGPFKAINDQFNAFLAPIQKQLYDAWPDPDKLQPVWQSLIDKYWNKSFFEAISEGIPEWSSTQLSQFGALGVGSGGFGPLYAVNFLELIRIIVTNWETNQQLWYHPQHGQGMQAVPEGFYTTPLDTGPYQGYTLKDLHVVGHGLKVTQVTQHAADQFQLSIKRQTSAMLPAWVDDWCTNEEASTINCNAVVIATTTRAMEMIGLTMPSAVESHGQNPLQAGTKTAIRKLHLMNSSKMFICTEKFWKKSGYDGPLNIQMDEMPRGVYTLDYPDTQYGVVLVSYTWGDDSTKALAVPTEERFELFKKIISRVSPEFGAGMDTRIQGTEIYNVDWELEPNAYGAFKLPYPGQDYWCQQAYFNFQRTDAACYLAGDSTSWSGGWTEGALHTGINAACAVARRFGLQVRANSPLAQDANLYQYPQPARR